MLIYGQNIINGTLSLEVNDPFATGVRVVNIVAGGQISVSDAFRFAPSVVDAINEGLIIVRPEAQDEVTQTDVTAHAFNNVFTGVTALDTVEPLFVSGYLQPTPTFVDGTVTVRNVGANGVTIKVTFYDFFGGITETDTNVAAGNVAILPTGLCAAFTVKYVRQTIGQSTIFHIAIQGFSSSLNPQ
jgi:hypothetical protein